MESLKSAQLDENLVSDDAGMNAEHSVQIGLLEALEEAVKSEKPAQNIGALLISLADYTEIHFNSEHLLMRMHSYPDFDAHDMDHDAFMDSIRDLQRQHRASDPIAAEAVTSLRKRIVGHIGSKDKAFASFIAENKPTA